MSLRFFRGIIVFFILAGVSGTGFFLFQKQKSAVISPIPDPPKPAASSIFAFSPKKNPDELKDKIIRTINGKWPNYSVYVKDLNSDFIAGINETVIFKAASINKIHILAALYDKANKGEVDLDQQITVQADDIQDYGTGMIRSEGPGGAYSIKTLAKLMMQQSDNTAAYILGNHILSVAGIQSLIESWGLTQTSMTDNKTSNKDVALIFSRILNEQIAKKPLTEELLAFMQNSDYEDRLPALLPKTVSVYHKIGTDIGDLHDVGVVVDGKARYFVGIFTSDITDEAAATQTIQQVSKVVFDFMK